MANLTDLRDSAQQLIVVIRNLTQLARTGSSDQVDDTNQIQVVEKLLKVVREAGTDTLADRDQRAESIGAARSALSEIIIQHTLSENVFDTTTIRTVNARRNSLKRAFGRLLERATFSSIPQLLSQTEIQEISHELAGAKQEIRQRQRAKDILDSVVGIALRTADLAMKLA